MTDAALVESLKAREPGSAELLFSRYATHVEHVIVSTVRFDPEVPDLVHEVFVRALEGIRSLRESWALKAWIGGVARFTALGFLRDRRMRSRWLVASPYDEANEPEAVGASFEVIRTLARTYAVLDALPADESTAFSLRVIEGMTLTKIAEVAGVSLATVKRRLTRAERLFWQRARRDPMLLEHAPTDGRRARGVS